MHFVPVQPVLAHVPLKEGGGVDGHGAVQKNGQTPGQLARRLELGDGVQHGLSTAYRKHRHHRHAAAFGQLLQQGAQLGKDFFLWVLAVAVGGLDQHRVRLRRWLRWVHECVVGSPQVT